MRDKPLSRPRRNQPLRKPLLGHGQQRKNLSRRLTGRVLATYDLAAEVLAHCEEQDKPYAIMVDGEFLDLDHVMEKHVGGG